MSAENNTENSTARLLRDARWMTGLTQAEAAQRAGVPRQTISSYESGTRRPSLDTLERLLAGCGLRLRLSVVPEPGLEDVPTRELLALPPLQRIDFRLQDAIVDLAQAVPDHVPVIVTGKTAARLHAACVRVLELEIAFAEQQSVDDIRAWLAAAYMAEPYPLTSADLRAGVRVTHGPEQETDVVVRWESLFTGLHSRSIALDLGRPEPLLARIAAPDDCCLGWHPRDRDHLALQRAVRLADEQAAGTERTQSDALDG